MEQSRKEILQAAYQARVQEVMQYQINIDNYTLALAEIRKLSNDEQNELQDFANQLQTLLVSEKLEQKKAKIILTVVQNQLE